MADKELTQKEFATLGAKATNSKYPKEVRSVWAKKGAEALKEKYGDDYFKKMAQKREAAKKPKRNPLKALLGLK